MGFQFFQVLVFGQELGKVVIGRESVKIGKDGISLNMPGIVQVDVGGIGVHGAYFLPNIIGRVAQVDAVAKTLTHFLLAIGAGKAACGGIFRQHDVRLHQHWGIGLIETTYQFACHLLVFTCRYGGCLEQSDVSSLADGIAEEAQWDVGFEVAHLDLSLHRGIALHTADGDEIHQVGGQLCQFRYLTLNKQDALLRVESCREIV